MAVRAVTRVAAYKRRSGAHYEEQGEGEERGLRPLEC